MPKAKTSRSRDYLRYVRSHASCLTWDPPLDPWPEREDPLFDPESFDSVAHHVRMGQGGGMGLKPSDYRTVPLTDQEHRALHQTGERSWWLKAGVDPRRVIISLLGRYVGSQWDAERVPEAELDDVLVGLEARADAELVAEEA